MPSGKDRFNQEKIGRPIADAIYKQLLGTDLDIRRYEHDNGFILDQVFAIDVRLKLMPSGLILLGQEKFLSYEYSKFESLTVEYHQNQFTEEPGDWFRLAAQFYFCGYLTENNKGFDPWVMANWPMIIWATHSGIIAWHDNVNKDGRARASFRYTKMRDIPSSCIIASSKMMQTQLNIW